jgi:hypothetical protein
VETERALAFECLTNRAQQHGKSRFFNGGHAPGTAGRCLLVRSLANVS